MTPSDVQLLLDSISDISDQEFDKRQLKRWTILLADVPCDLVTAKRAVVKVLQRQARVEPHEAIEQIKMIRRQRISENPITQLPDRGDGDVYRPELVSLITRIANGGQGLAQIVGEIMPSPVEEQDGSSAASVAARAAVHAKPEWWVRWRDEALKWSCGFCGAVPGEVCLAAGAKMVDDPAHHARLVVAGLVEDDRADMSAWVADQERRIKAQMAANGFS